MSHDLYASLSGAMATWRHLDVVADNLANASTTGFREGRVAYTEWGPEYARLAEVRPALTMGTLRSTGLPTDLALTQPNAWFVVGGGDGTRLTRDGHFAIDPNGRLVTQAGAPVAGGSGDIFIPAGETFTVAQDGWVVGSESGEIAQIRVVQADAVALGNNLWEPRSAMMDVDVPIVQGSLEESTTDPMRAMTELVEVSRWFEAFQKVMQASEDLDDRLYRIGGGG